MNQEQNNLNPNNFNTQGNNGIPNNQPLNNQSFNNTFNQNVVQNPNVNQSTFNQQPINPQPQPQPMPSFQQPINQMNIEQPTPQSMNTTFESGNTSNQSFNSKPPKKMNLGLIIGIVAVVVVAIIITILALSNKDGNVGSFGGGNNKNQLNGVVFVGGNNGNLIKTTNGTDWENVKLPSSDKINSSELIVNGINYINGEYILYARKYKNSGFGGPTILYRSKNGTDWELLTGTVDGTYSANWRTLDYINNNYYAISQSGATATRQLYYGQDLHSLKKLFENDDLFINWGAYVLDYAYGNNKFVVHVEREKKYYETGDSIVKYFYVSTDGQNFEKTETDTALDEMDFGGNIFIGISAFENYGIYKSDDGINWTKVFTLDKWSDDYGIVYRDNNFYVWYDNSIYISSDGTNWKEFYKGADNQGINNFDYKNGTFAYTTTSTESDPTTHKYVHTFRVFISTDGKKWLESSPDYKNFDYSSLYILEK